MNNVLTILISTLSGLTFGYLSATLIESIFHQKVSDAPAGALNRWKKWPSLCKPLIRANYSHHIVHHSKTFKKNHVTQFGSADEKEALNQALEALGKHGDIIKNSDYAVKLGGSGAISFLIPFVPLALLSYLLINVEFTIAFSAMSVLPALLSHFAHPYLHMKRHIALEKAPRLLRWFIRTRYFNTIAQYHYVHHRRVSCNYNLLLGGDFLRELFRRFVLRDENEKRKIMRSPTKDEIHHMQEIGLISKQ